MSARYQDGFVGRFICQDPAFLAVGNDGQIKEITGQELRQYLSDPQNLNSYSYVKNNPLVAVDPNGKWIELIIGEKNAVNLGNWASNNTVARYATDHPFQTGAVLGVAGGAAVAGGVLIGGGAITCGALCGPVAITGGIIGSESSNLNKNTLSSVSSNINKVANIVNDHLQSKDYAGFIRDVSKSPVWSNNLQRNFNHYQEVMDARTGLVNSVQKLTNIMQNNNLDAKIINSVRQAISQATQNINKIDKIIQSH